MNIETELISALNQLRAAWTDEWPTLLDINVRAEFVAGVPCAHWSYWNPAISERREFPTVDALISDATTFNVEAETQRRNRAKAAQLRAEADKLELEAK